MLHLQNVSIVHFLKDAKIITIHSYSGNQLQNYYTCMYIVQKLYMLYCSMFLSDFLCKYCMFCARLLFLLRFLCTVGAHHRGRSTLRSEPTRRSALLSWMRGATIYTLMGGPYRLQLCRTEPLLSCELLAILAAAGKNTKCTQNIDINARKAGAGFP